MPYSQFTLAQVKKEFGLTIVEGVRFFPEVQLISPSQFLQDLLTANLPWAIAVSSEKARSEAIINPILLEVRRILHQTISVFSGEEFNVDANRGLTGVCDFLISRSSEQLILEAPAIVIVEAKKEDLKVGLGQCIAEMIAAQTFNSINEKHIPSIYGTITSGTSWRFLKLTGMTVTIDLNDYPILPVEQILSFLVWMVVEG